LASTVPLVPRAYIVEFADGHTDIVSRRSSLFLDL
jgi:hypothetical protein